MAILSWIALCFVVGAVLSGPVPKVGSKFEPKSYEIEINFIENSGNVIINTELSDPLTGTTAIELNVGPNLGEIKLEDVLVWCKNPETNLATGVDTPADEILTIGIELGEEELGKGSVVVIDIKYKLKSTNANGINEYTYEAGGTTHKVTTTHFQPTYARNFFPCFDQPKYQATFDLTLTVPDGHTAISNTDKVPKEPEDNIIKFKQTPKMSTNMLGFVIYHEGTFGPLPDTTRADEGITFTTYARKSEVDGAMDMGERFGSTIVDAMTSYTKIDYDGATNNKVENVAKKLDQVALPNYSLDYGQATYGLATYDESALLVQSAGHSKATMERAVETIAYGVAHHWFGDLVTTDSWKNAWLNEGFSTFFDYFLSESAMDEDWRMQERLVVVEQMKALEADAASGTPSLTDPQTSSENDLEQFRIIASSKGASVLRMFQNAIGETKFQTAVQDYLAETVGGLSDPDKLFQKLVQNEFVKEDFVSWTTSQGFPLITITRDEPPEEEEEEVKSSITISQERFISGEESDETLYHLFLNIQSNASDIEEFKTIQKVTEKEKIIKVEIPEDAWILVKSDGYYRVNYEHDNWNLLAKHLRKQLSTKEEKEVKIGENKEEEEVVKISPLERAVLVDNALKLAQEGVLNYSVALGFVSFLQEEEDYITWAAALPGLDFLHRMFAGEDKNENTIEKLTVKIVNKAYTNLKAIESPNHMEKLLLSHIQPLACRAGHTKCISDAESTFTHYGMGHWNDADLKDSVFCYAVKNKGDNWESLWKELTGQQTTKGEIAETQGRSILISALGCSSSKEKLQKYLQATVPEDPTKREENPISEREIPAVFASVFANVKGIDFALSFLAENIKMFESSVAKGIIKEAIKYLKSEDQRKQLNEIKKQVPELAPVVNEADAALTANKKWVDANGENVAIAIEYALAQGPAGGGAYLTTPGTFLIILTALIAIILQ